MTRSLAESVASLVRKGSSGTAARVRIASWTQTARSNAKYHTCALRVLQDILFYEYLLDRQDEADDRISFLEERRIGRHS